METIMLSRTKILRNIFELYDDTIYVINTGYISRAVYDLFPKQKNIFYMQGSMGLAPCIGLGIAMNTKKNVVVITGDASILMQLGITHTIRDANLSNLYVYILDNKCHESVGGFKCSHLESSYVGVNSIIEINKEGKMDRVGIDCITNANNIREILL